MDIHSYTDIQRVWIWSAIHVHAYFYGRGTVGLIDLGLDLVLQYSSKPALLQSLLLSGITGNLVLPLSGNTRRIIFSE
jgi:hypothetical protein